MKTNLIRLILASLAGGLGMWILAGLWHNLVLPSVDETIHPHHEGIFIMLIAYIILGMIMAYLYARIVRAKKPVIEGLIFGVIIGILWVFPHGLAMAGTHGTSVLYEIKNAFWHMVEQGVGGIIIGSIIGKR